MDGQPGPGEQAAQVVDAGELAHGVEAPVEDAVPRLKVGEQSPERLGRRLRLRGQVGGLGLLQLLPHPSQARRVLPDEQLRREVQGVERPGEGPELRLVDLEAHHLADAELHPVKAHRPVVVQVRQHEERGQVGRRLGYGGLGFHAGRTKRLAPAFCFWRLLPASCGYGSVRCSGLRRLMRSGGLPRRGLRSASRDSSNKVFQRSLLLRSMGWGRCLCAAARPRPWPTAPGLTRRSRL